MDSNVVTGIQETCLYCYTEISVLCWLFPSITQSVVVFYSIILSNHDVIIFIVSYRKEIPDLTSDTLFLQDFALHIFTCKTNMTQSSYSTKYTHLKCKSNPLTRHALRKPYKLDITVKQSIFRRDLFA